jgi:hypothetical protein
MGILMAAAHVARMPKEANLPAVPELPKNTSAMADVARMILKPHSASRRPCLQWGIFASRVAARYSPWRVCILSVGAGGFGPGTDHPLARIRDLF